MSLLSDVQNLAISKVPTFKVGATIRVHQKIKEGDKERIQIFEGLVIAIGSGHGADKTFTVRKIVDAIAVERVFPLYSPIIKKIDVKKESKVRRSKLYYMRDLSGKSARMKETMVSEKEFEQSVEELAKIKAKEEAEKAAKEGTAVAEATETKE